MKRSILIAVVVVVVVVIVAVGGFLACTQLSNPLTPAATPTPTVATADDASNAAVAYVIANHADSGLTTDLNWTGGRQDTGLVGSDTTIYTAGNWNVTVTNPVIPNPIYTVSVVYNDAATHVTIDWEGTYQNSTIKETSYNFVVPP
jgi:hypothetical protein